MLVTPPSRATPLQPRKTESTRSDWNNVVANGSTSECCFGRSVPPVTTMVKRGWAASSSERDRDAARDHGEFGEIAPVDERLREGGGGGADVDDDGLTVGDQPRGRGGDRRLLGGVALGHLLERALAAAGVERHGAAVDPERELALLQDLEVGADRDGADPEPLGEVTDPHEALLLQQLLDQLDAHLRREMGSDVRWAFQHFRQSSFTFRYLSIRKSRKLLPSAPVPTTLDDYEFDLRGFLVVPGALSSAEVDDLNAAYDRFPSLANGESHEPRRATGRDPALRATVGPVPVRLHRQR